MSAWGSFDVVFAALSSSAACFALALALLASILAWSSSMTRRTELLLSRSIWGCVTIGCAFVAVASLVVLIGPTTVDVSS
ncbi:hypothetical protein QCD70_04730 [Agreia sp. PsM10]|uniref:hypothetical protein n=1 Tax=Agreia sp. PsM10 TaxID=3030533 RepID=UPI00263A550D|nr:hypothetical protein [Agreia sp. PsM10]MDN4639543.1 hypothetical protein [Agreia sp. PsM10]